MVVLVEHVDRLCRGLVEAMPRRRADVLGTQLAASVADRSLGEDPDPLGRFVGRHLVVRDVDANTIVDYLLNVVP